MRLWCLCAVVVSVRECGVFLASAQLFSRFLLNVKTKKKSHSILKKSKIDIPNFILVILINPRTDHLYSLSSLNSLFKRSALHLSTRTSLKLKVRTICWLQIQYKKKTGERYQSRATDRHWNTNSKPWSVLAMEESQVSTSLCNLSNFCDLCLHSNH